ncbi:MAG TPA: helix-hairpin-helix domain-containing protein, partial [Thermoanaerobaculia bacterium]|nr:helix-hairpin-helix domain-containing protein [Thermoanaerobaculia bacterium]
GKLNAALTALARLGLEEVPAIGLAKREEALYLPGHPDPLVLSRHDAGLQLLQRIRDECHRFALSRHRARRSKRSLRSLLDDVAGIGPARKRALLRRYGTLDAIRKAESEEVRRLIGGPAAERLREALAASAEPSST